MHTKLAGCWADGSQKNANEPNVRRQENRRCQQQVKRSSTVPCHVTVQVSSGLTGQVAQGTRSSLTARRCNEKQLITPHRTSQQVVMLWLINEPTFALCDWGMDEEVKAFVLQKMERLSSAEPLITLFLQGRRDFNFRTGPVCLGERHLGQSLNENTSERSHAFCQGYLGSAPYPTFHVGWVPPH